MTETDALRRTVSALAGLAVLAAAGCASDPEDGAASDWNDHMQSAVAAVEGGDPETGVSEFRTALEVAREDARSPNELAYAAWHLGDLCFGHPSLCEPDEAEACTLEALRTFEARYGPEHPVVIPVLLRLAEIRDGQGDDASASELREKADRITDRSFPESHFMRARMGTHRPASDLHPQELLRILSEVDPLDG